MWLIDKIINVLYTRAPGDPDRDSIWTKLFVLFMLGTLFAIRAAANWR